MKLLEKLNKNIHIKMLAYVDEINTSLGSALSYSVKSNDNTIGSRTNKMKTNFIL